MESRTSPVRGPDSHGIGEFIFAGDYCLSGPFPDECIAALMSLEHTHIVRDNEEKYLENLGPLDRRPDAGHILGFP